MTAVQLPLRRWFASSSSSFPSSSSAKSTLRAPLGSLGFCQRSLRVRARLHRHLGGNLQGLDQRPSSGVFQQQQQQMMMLRSFASSSSSSSSSGSRKKPKEEESDSEDEHRESELEKQKQAKAKEEAELPLSPLSIPQRVSRFIRQYGFVGVATYLGIYLATLFSLYTLISSGAIAGSDILSALKSLGIGGELLDRIDPKAGNFAIAWIAAKFTEPLRLGITIALTPWIARVVNPILGPILAPFVALARNWVRSKRK